MIENSHYKQLMKNAEVILLTLWIQKGCIGIYNGS